ncbi:urea ABC transporter permease subunit UrtB [Desulfovibrio desulfuricans]|uniref:urea ABC transporter permease subunit UrtB n=1 Tax=Desulfovibrio desulfuricans TaxID=876 RepID=UPI001AE913FC|nr:urea ABC transporter permease subunit UrtB [Desulfovibrio desulfuricans]QTO40531.1 urea ABC transporter permease subunit UrtB [Desulfovibrio desulfuricans]
MRTALLLCCLIIFSLPPAVLASGPEPDGNAGGAVSTPSASPVQTSPSNLPADLLKALVSPKVADRDAAIAALEKDDSSLAAPLREKLLEALLRNTLLADAAAGALFVSDDAGQARPLDAKGELGAVQPADNLRKVGTSNRQRQRITDILNAQALTSTDTVKRRQASAALMDSATPPLKAEALHKLLDGEKDEAVRANLSAALALYVAADPASVRSDQLAAVKALNSNGSPAALNALRTLAASSDTAVAKAADDALYSQRVSAQWAQFFEMLFFGTSLGSILVLAAIGLAITFGVMGVINMAHGELIMLGAYTAWGMQQLLPGQPGLALILAVPAAFLVSGGTGVLLEKTVIRFLYGRPLETLLATFGISLVLQQAVRTVFSPLNRAVQNPEFMSGVWQITQHFSLTCNRVYIILFCLGVFALIHVAMHRTRLGLEVRAVSQNRAIARCMGIRASRVDALTFGLGSGVAGMAGVALSQVSNVGPNLGQTYIVDSFMVVVFGGVGNLWGTLTGGLALGIANKFLEPASGAMLSKIIILVCLILFIQKRPRGLFPQKGRAVEA